MLYTMEIKEFDLEKIGLVLLESAKDHDTIMDITSRMLANGGADPEMGYITMSKAEGDLLTNPSPVLTLSFTDEGLYKLRVWVEFVISHIEPAAKAYYDKTMTGWFSPVDRIIKILSIYKEVK